MLFRKKAVLTAALAVATVVAMSGCASGSSSSGPVTITLWEGFAGTESAALAKLVDKYWTPEHPDIKVKVEGEKTPESILTAMTGSDSPDVVIAASSEEPTVWYHSGAIRDLSSMADGISDDLDTKIVPAARAWGVDGDTTFALPFVDYNWGIYYNKAMFKAAGLDPEKPPTTIDELEADAKKLTITDSSGNIKQLGWVPVHDEGSAIALSMAFGAKFIDGKGQPTIDSPEVEKALTWDSNLAGSFGLKKVAEYTSGFTKGDNPFALGKAAIYIDGSWGAAMLKDSDIDFGYGAIPASEPAYADSNPVGTNPIVIPKASPHPKEAEEFAKFLALNPKLSSEFSAAISNIPQVKADLSTFSDDPATVFFANLTNSPNARAWAPVPYAQAYIDEFIRAVGQIYNGGADVDATLKESQKNLVQQAETYK